MEAGEAEAAKGEALVKPAEVKAGAEEVKQGTEEVKKRKRMLNKITLFNILHILIEGKCLNDLNQLWMRGNLADV